MGVGVDVGLGLEVGGGVGVSIVLDEFVKKNITTPKSLPDAE